MRATQPHRATGLRPANASLGAPKLLSRVSSTTSVHASHAKRPTVLTRAAPKTTEKEKAPATAPGPGPVRPRHDPGHELPNPPPPKYGVEPPSTVEVVIDKATDTGLDIYRHLRRLAADKSSSSALDRLVRGPEGRFQLKRQAGRAVVLVLGSGWAAHSCIKVIDTDKFDVFVVSPRNFFCFTPMLPSTAVGTVEFRSLLEPIRTSNEFVGYLEAGCDKIDVDKKVAMCTSAVPYDGGQRSQFELPYDILVVAVGEKTATFGVPGVNEYCCFMKEISDTVRIRNKIGGCFEQAALPGTTDEDRRRLLHFVVVGGGPTGVEFAGTLSDYVRSDLKRKYPQLMQYVKVSLLQSAQGILTQFDSKLAKSALDNLNKTGVTVKTGVRVVEVTEREVVIKDGDRLPYGLCVWSCGNSARPLVQSLVSQLPEQAEYQSGGAPRAKLAVDGFQRVIGARDVLALGDCCTVVGEPLPSTAQVAAQQGAYMAHVINRGYIIGRGGMDGPPPCRPLPRGPLGLTLPIALPGLTQSPIAQVDLNTTPIYDALAEATVVPGAKLGYCRQKFVFQSLGIMAYVGGGKALTQIEAGDASFNLYGSFAYLLWRSVYITKQVSFRNRVLILFDWLKAKVFGRDLSMF